MTILFLTAGILLITAFLTLWYFENKFKELISDEHFTLLTAQAHDIDNKIESAHNMLIAVSRVVPLDALDKDRQKWLSDRTGIQSIFDNGIFLFSKSGGLIVEAPYIPGRRGPDYSDSDFIRETLATGKPVISQPFISRENHHHPIVVMTAPVFDKHGKVRAILAGSLDLMKDNFLSSIAQLKLGKSGHLYLFDKDRRIIIHPDKSRMLKQDIPPGVNRLFDMAVLGFEGSGETMISQNVRSLSSFKHLRTNWILAANYPVSEAYEPVRTARSYFFLLLAVALIITVLIVWFAMKHLISPLLMFAKHAEETSFKTGDAGMFPLRTGDETGKMAGAFNAMIGELDRQHEALRASEERYRVFIETSLDGVYFTDKNGVFGQINISGAVILGHSIPEEVIGRSAADYWSDNADWERFIDELMREKSIRAFVMRGRKIDGSDIYVETTSRLVEDKHGRVIGIEGIFRDITERKKIEDELNSTSEALAITSSAIDRERAELREAIEGLSALIQQVVNEQNMNVRFDNPNLKKCYREMNCVKRDCVCFGGDGNRCWQVVGTYGGEKPQCEYSPEISSCDECPVFQFATSEPAYKIGEQFNNMMHILETKSMELKSAQAHMLQHEKMASIGQLAAGVAHEINNPIGFIMSNLGSLEKYTNRLSSHLTEQSQALKDLSGRATDADEVLKRVDESKRVMKIDYILDDIHQLIKESLDGAGRVKQIVLDFKGFSHVDQAEQKPVDINQCLESTINIVWNELKYKATLRKELGTLPKTRCNPGQLNQVFVNLLVNAAQAIEKQGEISIKTWRDNGNISISIADSGCGIPKENLGRIFEPFFTTKEIGKGTGLGLSIAYDIVKKHKGAMTVESEVGKGTSFTVSVPVLED